MLTVVPSLLLFSTYIQKQSWSCRLRLLWPPTFSSRTLAASTAQVIAITSAAALHTQSALLCLHFYVSWNIMSTSHMCCVSFGLWSQWNFVVKGLNKLRLLQMLTCFGAINIFCHGWYRFWLYIGINWQLHTNPLSATWINHVQSWSTHFRITLWFL